MSARPAVPVIDRWQTQLEIGSIRAASTEPWLVSGRITAPRAWCCTPPACACRWAPPPASRSRAGMTTGPTPRSWASTATPCT